MRTQWRHHQETIGHTRLLAILIVIGAALTFAGHQFWPRVSTVADRVTGVSTSKSSSSSHKQKAASKTSSEKVSTTKKKSSSSSTKNVTAESAVTIVEGYFKSHPDEQTDTISQYKAVGTGSDSTGAYVFKVGAYGVDDTGATSELHEYWVHRDGKFDVAY